MAFSVAIVDEAGTTHTLSGGTVLPGTATTNLVELTGIGTPRVERQIQLGLNHSVHEDLGFKLMPRRITLTIYIEGATIQAGDFARDEISQIFQPTHNPLNLKVEREDGQTRQIDVFLDGQIDYPMGVQQRTGGFTQTVVIPLIAPDPTWYDATQNTQTLSISSGTAQSNIGAADLTWYDYPVIEVDGPITNMNIGINGFSGANIQSFTISSGRTFTFDFRPGKKTIKDDLGANQIDQLGIAFTENMHGMLRIHDEKFLAAYSSGALTSTQITFSGTGTDGNTEARIKYYDRYMNL